MTSIQTLDVSNQILTRVIQLNKKFIFCRPGIGGDTFAPYLLHYHRQISKYQLNALQVIAGIYFRTHNLSNQSDKDDFKTYAKYVIETFKQSLFVGCFVNVPQMNPVYSLFKPSQCLHSRVLEPFYLNSSKTWLDSLRGKKVLLVSSFAHDMIQQVPKLDKIWSNTKFRIPKDIQWIPYKTYMTLANNKLHQSWKETYELMCKDIQKLDFDVALLSCGGYGNPLCHFIYNKMGKTSIYIGGGLQIWFGIKGKRWMERADFRAYMNEHWIFPKDEPNNKQLVEGGSYWK